MPTREETLPLWPDGAPGAKGNGPEDTPRITLFLPESAAPLACIAVFPGGGYGGRAPHEGVPIARWVNSLGLAAAVVDYRVSPYRHPIPLGDAQRAVRTLRANAADWGIDPDRIGVLGFSAGGHLVTSAATIFDAGKPDSPDPVERCSCRPNALIACYPVITFDRDRHHGSMVNLLGDENGKVDEELRLYLSLERRVTPETPPAFIWHTADDSVVPVSNALLLAKAMGANGVPYSLHVFPHGRHGLGLAQDDPVVGRWTALCADWLVAIGFR